MPRNLSDARRWTNEGTKRVGGVVTGLDEALVAGPSTLPGWSRKHLLAHLAANAEALSNLVRWAATGVETPMYASPQARAAGIASGATMSAEALGAWFTTSAGELEQAMDGLTPADWHHTVVTGQGRSVTAAEIPWLRAREVCVHAVDLDSGVAFTDLPADFLVALCDDIVAKRSASEGPAVDLRPGDVDASWVLPGSAPAVAVIGQLAEVAAYLSGRPHQLTTTAGAPAPALSSWL